MEGSLVEVYALTETGAFPISAYTSEFETNIDAELSGRDINNDGLPEIVLSTFRGGNSWESQYIQVFKILPTGEMKELTIEHPEDVVLQGLEDIDKDGTYEIIGLDTHWEYKFGLCHACSPAVMKIYIWQEGKYVDGSKKFSKIYDEEISKLESRLPGFSSRENYIGDVISILLNYIQKGEDAKGWARFKTLTDRREFHNKKSARWIQKIGADIKTYYVEYNGKGK